MRLEGDAFYGGDEHAVKLPGDVLGQLAAAFKVIADPARLRLLSLLASMPQGEACVCDVTEPLALSQPTVSHHLKSSTRPASLGGERRGLWVYYPLASERLQILRDALGAPTIGQSAP